MKKLSSKALKEFILKEIGEMDDESVFGTSKKPLVRRRIPNPSQEKLRVGDFLREANSTISDAIESMDAVSNLQTKDARAIQALTVRLGEIQSQIAAISSAFAKVSGGPE